MKKARTKFENIRVINWNIAGAKYFEKSETERGIFKENIQKALIRLIEDYIPDVITLQEVVNWGDKNDENGVVKEFLKDANDIIDIYSINKILEENKLETYEYFFYPLIDTEKVSSKAKWKKVIKKGKWYLKELEDNIKEKDLTDNDIEDLINKVYDKLYFAQGNAFLFRKDIGHFPIWDLSKYPNGKNRTAENRNSIEKVHLDTGLYFGDRNTEPRAALVAHFIIFPEKDKDNMAKPMDVFVVNTHLTTLRMERDGIPQIDLEATKMRLAQLEIIFYGIVSRYNMWRQDEYRQRNDPYKPKKGETTERHNPLWILAGDFNFTPMSIEYDKINKMNFMDLIPEKRSGTKAQGIGQDPTLTLDYIFGGPKFISLNPIITEPKLKDNVVINHKGVRASDHYPLFAKIPVEVSEKRKEEPIQPNDESNDIDKSDNKKKSK